MRLQIALTMNRSYRRKVLDCASPLALSTTHDVQSARGLAQSKTLTRANRRSGMGEGSGVRVRSHRIYRSKL